MDSAKFFWPDPASFLDLSRVTQVSNNWAHCTEIAVCDQEGHPCNVFNQGQTASFFHEFEFLQDIEVPIGGVRIDNNKGIIVYSKGSIFFDVETPRHVRVGERVRFRQNIRLDIAPGEYTFSLILSTMSYQEFIHRAAYPYFELESKIIRLNTVVNAGVFEVRLPYLGGPIQLLHHGVANLPGDCAVKLMGQ
jgi:lipopolysaccharide transport system ATP-binding protein